MISSRRALASALALVSLIAVAAPSLSVPATAAPQYIDGIDVSHWQGNIDWASVRQDNIQFAFIKATEGTTFVDNRYATNRAGAEAAGVLAGAYHFAQPGGGTADAIAEADHYIHTAGLAGRHMLPVLDLEEDNGLSTRALRRWARAWLARVEERLGVKSIIYTSPAFWHDHMGDSTWFAQDGHRLWIAHYTSDPAPLVPASNWAGKGWTIWQHSNRGSVDGIAGDVDLDRYVGTRLGPLKIRNNR